MAEVSFSKEAFAIIKDRLGLPDHYLRDIPSDHIIRTTAFSCRKTGQQLPGLIFKLPFYRDKFYQISVSYDLESHTTYGIILAQNSPEALAPLLTRLELHQSNLALSSHPLLLPILAIELEMERISGRVHDWDKRLNELEETMGQHEYVDRPSGNPLEMNFTTATRKLNHISKKLGVDALTLGFVMLALETVESWSVDTKSLRRERNEESKGAENGACVEMEEKTTWLKDRCRSLLLLAEYEDKRTKTLIQVVYQYMAQKDAQVNIDLAKSSEMIAKASKEDSAVMREIAVEAKKDSSSMKTIAVLGMFFLPGTFVAAIFAMPVFSWDGNEVPAVNAGFGYYWAVAVPLTVLVLVFWGVAMLFPWRKWLSRFRRRPRMHEMELTDVDA